MNNESTSLLLLAMFLTSAPLCLADGPMDCISEMTIPNVNGPMMTSIPATINVRVTIGKNGRARSVDYGDTKAILRIALDQFFKEENRYRPACQGRTISFKLRYILAARA